jgi:hypothetical protein
MRGEEHRFLKIGRELFLLGGLDRGDGVEIFDEISVLAQTIFDT